MYLDYYNLKKEPFGITPDPEFLFLSPSHKEALASIIYGVKMRKGFVAVTGEVGVGKTTVIRSYLDKADKRSVKVIYIFNAAISFSALLKTIIRELGMIVESDKVFEMLNQLHRELIEHYRKKINVVLIIDEAQNMPVSTLENLRMLSNLETTKEKLIQIIFSGQPEFERMLARTELRQLRQRIAVKVSIRRLTKQESRAYIRHRLARASAGNKHIFTTPAAMLLVNRARGIPRVINILCGNSLVTAFGYNQKRVKYRIVREVISDMEAVQGSSPAKILGSAFLAVILLMAAVQFVFNNRSAVADMLVNRIAGLAGLLKHGAEDDNPAAVHKEKPAPAAKEDDTRTNKTIPETPSVFEAGPQAEAKISAAPSGAPADNRKEEAIPPAQADSEFDLKQEKTTSLSVPEAKADMTRPRISTPPSVVTKVVCKGDNLTRLTREVYGYCNDELIARVSRYNPGIKDVDIIFEGESIVFPVN